MIHGFKGQATFPASNILFALVLLMFLYGYPPYTDYPISEVSFQQHLGFRSRI